MCSCSQFPARWALGRIWHSFGFRIVVKPHARAFFPGVDAIKRLPDHSQVARGPNGWQGLQQWPPALEKYILCFSGLPSLLPPLYRASGQREFCESVRIVAQRDADTQLETHIRWVIKNTFPLFVSNVNTVLGWELFPGLKITTVNINVMLPHVRFSFSFLFTWSYCFKSLVATCTGRGSSRPGVVKARPPSSS